jgi:hypothetical protein
MELKMKLKDYIEKVGMSRIDDVEAINGNVLVLAKWTRSGIKPRDLNRWLSLREFYLDTGFKNKKPYPQAEPFVKMVNCLKRRQIRKKNGEYILPVKYECSIAHGYTHL